MANHDYLLRPTGWDRSTVLSLVVAKRLMDMFPIPAWLWTKESSITFWMSEETNDTSSSGMKKVLPASDMLNTTDMHLHKLEHSW